MLMASGSSHDGCRRRNGQEAWTGRRLQLAAPGHRPDAVAGAAGDGLDGERRADAAHGREHPATGTAGRLPSCGTSRAATAATAANSSGEKWRGRSGTASRASSTRRVASLNEGVPRLLITS